MERWKLAVCDPEKNDGAQLFLMNRSTTLVTVHKRVQFDPLVVFKKLEEIQLPVRYTDGLERIHFSILPGNTGGWYLENQAVVDVGKRMKHFVVETLVHEIGHHVDELEGVSPLIHGLRCWKGKFMGERMSKRNDAEYFAIGFQKFYSEDPNDRKMLREKNPQLYILIRKLHSEYHKKG